MCLGDHEVNLGPANLVDPVTVDQDQIVPLQISHGTQEDHIQKNPIIQINLKRRQKAPENLVLELLHLTNLRNRDHIDQEAVLISPDRRHLHRIDHDHVQKAGQSDLQGPLVVIQIILDLCIHTNQDQNRVLDL